jgi:glycosyltransferase involved in cell wall biosynthesis
LRLTARRARDSGAYPTHELRGRQIAFVWQYHGFFLRSGTAFARREGLPIVEFVDALEVWQARRWGVKRPGWGPLLEARGEMPQLRAADLVACVSRDVADTVIAAGIASDRVLVTPNATDTTRFHPGVRDDRARRRWGLCDEHFVVGWVGSFRRFHGLEQLVAAFHILLAAAPEARLLLVGEGAERSMIEAEVIRLGIRPQTIFTGQVPHEEVPGLVRAMDVAVVTAANDDFHYSPLKLQEYLGCAVPVVAPRVGQVEETLSDDREALLYPVADFAGLASALERLARSPGLRTRIGRAGHASEVERGGIAAQLDLILERLSVMSETGD